MSEIGQIAMAFTASSHRWSREAEPWGRRTLWYGMVCNSFVLLDQLLRLSTLELVNAAGVDAAAYVKTAPRGINAATMGQCITLLTDYSGAIESSLGPTLVALGPPLRILPNADKARWLELIRWRNKLMHNGPGYVDSIDLFAGRNFSGTEKLTEVNRAALGESIWAKGRDLCESRAVLAASTLQGADPFDLRAQLRAGARPVYKRVPTAQARVLANRINEFHADCRRSEPPPPGGPLPGSPRLNET